MECTLYQSRFIHLSLVFSHHDMQIFFEILKNAYIFLNTAHMYCILPLYSILRCCLYSYVWKSQKSAKTNKEKPAEKNTCCSCIKNTSQKAFHQNKKYDPDCCSWCVSVLGRYVVRRGAGGVRGCQLLPLHPAPLIHQCGRFQVHRAARTTSQVGRPFSHINIELLRSIHDS